MRNNLSALNDYLFESIERIQSDELSDEELDREIKRAEARLMEPDTGDGRFHEAGFRIFSL